MSDFADMLKQQLIAAARAKQSDYEQGYQAGYAQGQIDATARARQLLEKARTAHQQFVDTQKVTP